MKPHATLILSIFMVLTSPAFTQSPRSYVYTNGQWWSGSSFQLRTFYSVAGVLQSKPPRTVYETIDLHGGYVIPPLVEGHNHWLEPSKIDSYNNCYLADGVFYVRDMANVPFVVDQFRTKVNRPDSVDWVSAMEGFTGPGGHPVEVIDQFVSMGVLPKTWKPDYDKQAEFVVETNKDIDERFPLLLAQHPAYVKAFLLYSDHYNDNLKDSKSRGNTRGMDPLLLPHLVKLAHAAGLKVVVHIYSAPDFRNAVASGADEVAHLPGTGYRADMPLTEFQITPSDARAAARAHITVTSTVSWLADMKDDDSAHFAIARDEVVTHNLKLLKDAGIRILIGSDEFRRDVVPEMKVMSSLGIYSNADLLNMDTRLTVENMFPGRRVGQLRDGYEASFIVLSRNPVQNFSNLSSIVLRIKNGRRLTVPTASTERPTPDCTQEAP